MKNNFDFSALRQRLGYEVTVNGKSLFENYSADFIDMEIVPIKFEYNFYRNVGRSKFMINNVTNEPSKRKLKFYVGGESIELAQLNVDNMIKDMLNEFVLKIDDTDFEYSCVLTTEAEVEYTGVDYYYLVVLEVNVVKRYSLVRVHFDSFDSVEKELVFWNDGVISSGLDIIVKSNGPGFSLNYFNESKNIYRTVTLNNLSTGQAYYKIGGIDGVVLKDSVDSFDNNPENIFGKSNLISFPIAKSGENKIVVNQNSVGIVTEVELVYYPVFIV